MSVTDLIRPSQSVACTIVNLNFSDSLKLRTSSAKLSTLVQVHVRSKAGEALIKLDVLSSTLGPTPTWLCVRSSRGAAARSENGPCARVLTALSACASPKAAGSRGSWSLCALSVLSTCEARSIGSSWNEGGGRRQKSTITSGVGGASTRRDTSTLQHFNKATCSGRRDVKGSAVAPAIAQVRPLTTPVLLKLVCFTAFGHRLLTSTHSGYRHWMTRRPSTLSSIRPSAFLPFVFATNLPPPRLAPRDPAAAAASARKSR